MKIGKPVTDNMKEKCNALFSFLKSNEGYVQKSDIQAFLERYDVTNERSVRDVISTLATKKPIISTSTSRGYKLARLTRADLEEVIHTWKEIDSRIEALKARREPLIALYEKAKEAGII